MYLLTKNINMPYLVENSLIIEWIKSNSQIVRLLTENWVQNTIFCPICWNFLLHHRNNAKVRDFYCRKCWENFELKSFKSKKIKDYILGSEYNTLIKQIISKPVHLFLLSYIEDYTITNFLFIPKYFFTPQIISPRKPLSSNAKRSGWKGSIIHLNKIPESGKIYFIKDRFYKTKTEILQEVQKVKFLQQETLDKKWWIFDIMLCIERIGRKRFYLKDMYQFEEFLKNKYPHNNNIKAKIRQQLQFLRNKWYLKFLWNWWYEVL